MNSVSVTFFILGLCIHSGFNRFNLKTREFVRFQFQDLLAIKSSVEVPEGTPKTRLDVYLASYLKDHSRSFYGNLCENGHVKVNTHTRDKAYKVSTGDTIEYEVNEANNTQSVNPENIPLDVLFEDEHIICVNKPNGMVVHPAPGSPNGTFVNALLYRLGDQASRLLDEVDVSTASAVVQEFRLSSIHDNACVNVDENEFDNDFDGEDMDMDDYPSLSVAGRSQAESLQLDLPETPEAAKATPVYLRPGVVHRLDKGTTGVLLAAKHSNAVAKMSLLFATRKVRKIYLAVCVGHPGEASIVEPIGRSTKNRQMMAVFDGPPGKMAITHVNTIAFDGKMSACLLRIETGRTHQIRVHMKHRRTPVAGDEAYGNSDWNSKLHRSNGVHRPLLHAYETQFMHPFTGETITVRAPIPDDMRALITKLSLGLSSPLIDQQGFLTCPVEVRGKNAGERIKGFVPSDRIMFEEEHWTSFDLPETMEDV